MSKKRLEAIAALDRDCHLYGDYPDSDIPKPIVASGETYYIFNGAKWRRYFVKSSTWERGNLFTSIPNPKGKHGRRSYYVGYCDDSGKVNGWYSQWDYSFIDAARGGNLAFTKADMKRLIQEKISKTESMLPQMEKKAIEMSRKQINSTVSQLMASL